MKTLALLTLMMAALSSTAHAALTVYSSSFPVRQIAADGNLYANGEVGIYANVPKAGTYTVTLYAAGTPAAGEYPVVGLAVNGFVKERKSIDGTIWGVYDYTAQLTAGVHQLGFWFHNNALINGEDRNVYILGMIVTSPAGTADVTLSTQSAFASAALARENHAVSDSASAIDLYRKGPAKVTVVNSQGQTLSGATVSVQQLNHDFRFGASVAGYNVYGSTALNNAYLDKFKGVFNFATVPMYWSLIEPVKGSPQYAWIDAMVNWCNTNSIRTKGHALLWASPDAMPTWMTSIPTQQAQLDRVSQLMQRYGASIKSWEVVNEPVTVPGMAVGTAEAWAKSISPNAELILNEYGHFYNGYPEAFDAISQAVAGGMAIDTIGIQAHAPVDMAFPLDRVQAVLNHYAQIGKSIHITEFTPSSGGFPVTGNPFRTTWDEATQADYAEKFYRVCFANPAVDAISWWDVCDAGAWVPGGGLLRADMSSKPAYDKLKNLITSEWRTNVSGSTASNGAYEFRGFYGSYRVTVTHNGVTKTMDVNLAKGAANNVTVSFDSAPVATPSVTVNTLVTKNTKPVLTGTLANATSVTVSVGGKTYNAVVNGTNWSATVTTALAAGTYNVVATAKNAAGQTSVDATTNELVIDIAKPVITLVGSASISIKKGSNYVDAGATATDNVDGNITGKIAVTNGVKTTTTGTYYVRYNVADTAGNAATQITRTVKVVN